MNDTKYFRRVTHLGYADWRWEIGCGSSWSVTPTSGMIDRGREPSRKEAIKAAVKAIEKDKRTKAARWVAVA